MEEAGLKQDGREGPLLSLHRLVHLAALFRGVWKQSAGPAGPLVQKMVPVKRECDSDCEVQGQEQASLCRW